MGTRFRLTSVQPQVVEMLLRDNSCLLDVGELVGFHGNSQIQRLIQKAAQKVAKGGKKNLYWNSHPEHRQPFSGCTQEHGHYGTEGVLCPMAHS